MRWKVSVGRWAVAGLWGQVLGYRLVWRFLVVFNVLNSFRTGGQALCGAVSLLFL